MYKLLTIAISAYNKENYLERCISSLISQKLELLEIIIVNDGSFDKTSDIAHSFEKSYPESIIVIDKENGHQGSCINQALKIATGKYFKMLDADDYFSTEILDYVITKLEETEADMIVTGHVITNNTPISVTPSNVKEDTLYNHDDIDFTEYGMANCLGMHGVAFRTKILQNNNIYLTEKCSFSDAEYSYYPLKFCKTIFFIKKNLYIYQTGVGGQESSLKSEKVKNDAYRICKRMIDDYISNNMYSKVVKKNEEIVLQRCLTAYLSLCLLYFKTNKEENIRIDSLLLLCRKNCPNVYEQLLKVHSRKLPFISIYVHTKTSSYTLFRFLNYLYKLRK